MLEEDLGGEAVGCLVTESFMTCELPLSLLSQDRHLSDVFDYAWMHYLDAQFSMFMPQSMSRRGTTSLNSTTKSSTIF